MSKEPGALQLSYVQTLTALEDYLGVVPRGWEGMTVARLEAQRRERRAAKELPPDILLRALAILAVVAHHAGWTVFAGGTAMLFALAGYNFARFTWRDDAAAFRNAILRVMLRIAAPSVLLAGAYMLWRQEVEPTTLLLVHNWIALEHVSIFPIWFVEVLLQILVVWLCLIHIPNLLSVVREHKFVATLGLLALAVGSSLVARQIWDTSALRHLLPQHFMWLFVIGSVIWFASSAKSPYRGVARKAVATVALLIAISLQNDIFSFNNELSRLAWLMIGGTMLIWLGPIDVPRRIALPFIIVSQASFYIYILHPVFGYLPRYVLEWDSGAFYFIFSLIGSLATYLACLALIRAR